MKKGTVRRIRYSLMMRMRNWSYVNRFCFEDYPLDLKTLFRSIKELQKHPDLLDNVSFSLK